MTLDEYIKKLEAVQATLPNMLSEAAENATLRAIEAAQDKTPPTADSLRGVNALSGELKQSWAIKSITKPERTSNEYVTYLKNGKHYASYVNDGHLMHKHFVPHLFPNQYSGMLEIDMGKEGGIMVGTKTHYVEGLHMTDAGIAAYRKTAEAELEKVRRKIEEMLK